MTPVLYVVDLNDRSDDVFRVTMTADLGPENEYYQFASTAPGTYQVMDMGRFVRSFEAFDASGVPVPTEEVTAGRWQFSRPGDVASVRYEIAETWDTPVDEHPIYMMAGSSIEDDHVFINGQTVFGFASGMQGTPLRIQFDHPASWTVGTALPRGEDGLYHADDYDHIVDSPVLMGRLSFAEVDVRGTDVELYTYSKTDKVKSEQILESVRDILFASDAFLGKLPVDRYAFLFHFEDMSMGAWEHSYSSAYVYAEDGFEQAIVESIPSVVAHEFFHIVTPLNIHSEIIEDFNFAEPVASEHLWLYEGTTEWASDMLQLRAELIDLDNYLNRLSTKLNIDDRFDPSYSLSKLSLTSYTSEGQRQYGNIYQRGAVVAGLLDIRLLELSGASKGLREVLIDLSNRYGPDRPFDEESFFDTFAELTHPEIADFFESYVRNANPLPIADYYRKLGIRYELQRETGATEASAGLEINVQEGRIVIVGVAPEVTECGFAIGDELVSYDGREVSMKTIRQLAAEWRELAAGIPYELTVRRGDKEEVVSCAKFNRPTVERHVFSIDPEATPGQIAMRAAWMRNLPL
ncbi:MAG: peptidase [Rhodothermales bacterium]|nr:peptidase [Rhodothermales bacterium]